MDTGLSIVLRRVLGGNAGGPPNDRIRHMRTFAATSFVLLAILYMTVPSAEIRRIKPTMTMVGGRVVFEDAKR
jgi:uncharacterized RDD family membrane protein YckC